MVDNEARFALVPGKRVWTHQAFPANGAHAARDRAHGGKALLTNWQPGNIGQGATAETTVGGEEDGEETFSDAAHRRDQGRHQ